MTKKKIIAAAAAAAILAGAVCGWFFAAHQRVAGRFYPKNAQVLDLREKNLSPEDYDAVCAAFPDRTVIWDLPFQDSFLPLDTESLTLTTLSQSDIPLLARLTKLNAVHADACRDYDALVCLQKAMPDCTVSYEVPVGEAVCSSLDSSLSLENGSAEEILHALAYLPNLRELRLSGTLPTPAEIAAVKAAGNDLTVLCQVPVGSETYLSDTQVLPLSGMDLSAEALKKVLPYFDALQTVEILDTPISQDQGKALADANPEVFFLMEMDIMGQTFRTDETSIDLSGIPMTVEEGESFLPYFKNLTHVYMSECGISNEDMDALNRRHADVRYVWTVYCGTMAVRTDATEFYPARISNPHEIWGTQCDNLRYCPDIITVDLGHMSVKNCDWAAYLPHLKYLLIPMTNIVDLTPLSELKELVFLEAFILEVKDYSPLLGCTALEDLNISYTYGDYTPLTQMSWLKHLYWGGMPNQKETTAILEKALPDTEIVWNLDHSQGGGWRYLPNYYRMRDSINAGYLGQQAMLMFWTQEEANQILACSFHPENPVGPVLDRILAQREADKKAQADSPTQSDDGKTG